MVDLIYITVAVLIIIIFLLVKILKSNNEDSNNQENKIFGKGLLSFLTWPIKKIYQTATGRKPKLEDEEGKNIKDVEKVLEFKEQLEKNKLNMIDSLIKVISNIKTKKLYSENTLEGFRRGIQAITILIKKELSNTELINKNLKEVRTQNIKIVNEIDTDNKKINEIIIKFADEVKSEADIIRFNMLKKKYDDQLKEYNELGKDGITLVNQSIDKHDKNYIPLQKQQLSIVNGLKELKTLNDNNISRVLESLKMLKTLEIRLIEIDKEVIEITKKMKELTEQQKLTSQEITKIRNEISQFTIMEKAA